MSFEDNILLSIKRKYTRDEEFAFLLGKLKEVQQENGILKSEIAELEYKLNTKMLQSKQRSIEEWRNIPKSVRKELRRAYMASYDQLHNTQSLQNARKVTELQKKLERSEKRREELELQLLINKNK